MHPAPLQPAHPLVAARASLPTVDARIDRIEIVQPREGGRFLRYVGIAAAAFLVGLVWNRLPASDARPSLAATAASARAASSARPVAPAPEPPVTFHAVRPSPAARATTTRPRR